MKKCKKKENEKSIKQWTKSRINLLLLFKNIYSQFCIEKSEKNLDNHPDKIIKKYIIKINENFFDENKKEVIIELKSNKECKIKKINLAYVHYKEQKDQSFFDVKMWKDDKEPIMFSIKTPSWFETEMDKILYGSIDVYEKDIKEVYNFFVENFEEFDNFSKTENVFQFNNTIGVFSGGYRLDISSIDDEKINRNFYDLSDNNKIEFDTYKKEKVKCNIKNF